MNTKADIKVKNTDYIIEATLRSLGLNNSYKGFRYLIYAIQLVWEDYDFLTYVCKGLYAEIAIHYHTTVANVERNIRTVKEVIWNNGDKETLRAVFGSLYYMKVPTNAQFIDALAFYIKSHLEDTN